MAKVTVKIVGLSHLTGGEKEIRLEATNIMDVLEKMKDRYVRFSQKAFLSDGELHPGIRMLINSKLTSNLTRKLKHGEVLVIFPTFGGG